MKETIFDLNETKRENKTFHFQPNQHYDAIKGAILKRNKQRKRTVKQQRVHEHIGGLPSPPVEDKKEILSVPSSPVEILPSSNDIRQKIKELQDEKHVLFQMLKSLMMQEQQKNKRQAEALAAEALKQKEQEQAQALSLARKRKELAEEEENRQQQLRKKSRWAPVVDNYYSSNNRYYPPLPRYHSSYNNTANNSRPPPPPPRSHHYSIASSSSSSRPPFPR